MKQTANALSESQLQKAVIERAQALGWHVMHPLPGQPRAGKWSTATSGDGKGYPDLTLVRERLVFVELKAEGKYLTMEQRAWRDWIQEANGEWYCWRPLQWFDGTVEVILAVKNPTASPLLPRQDVVTDPERFRRLLKGCSGDEEQAWRIYNAISH